jgi:hypothetical protein
MTRKKLDEINFKLPGVAFEMNIRQLCLSLLTVFFGVALVIVAMKAGCEYHGKKGSITVPGQTIELPNKK